MNRLLAIIAIVIPLVLTQTPVRQCSNGADLPASVDINGCIFSPCSIQNGAPIRAVAVGIISPIDTERLEAYITVRLAGLQIPFPMPDDLKDACSSGVSSGTCPITAGQSFDYTLNHAGQALGLSGITVQVEVGLRADDGTVVACLEFDAKIVA
ncbi:NPC intracellular cholesterol transporter 2-like [Topomyia yanbarensis]|uniref:NPC intracellular cholesterol transporter 2-like n=1 Tax=Topomyia yanbarensis TaxID=2498891 RepID=UPI00273B532B|nr:NPC intracellular cholesterol transporter 2-like [Topomyia yanbarensis]